MENISEGYVARDKNGSLFLYEKEPDRDDKYEVFISHDDVNCYEIDADSFPDVTWETEPRKVEIIIREI